MAKKDNNVVSNLFWTDATFDFFNQMRKIYTTNVNQHYGYYIAISRELTENNDLYGESTQKVFSKPILMYGILQTADSEPDTKVGGMPDVIYRLKFFVTSEEVLEKGISIKDGDYILLNDNFYEIENFIYGQNYPRFELNCRIVREQVFDIKFTDEGFLE